MKILKQYLNEDVDFSLPDNIIDRNGYTVVINEDKWRLHTGCISNDSINIGRYKNPILKYAVSRYLIMLIQTKAPSTVTHAESHIFTKLLETGFLNKYFHDKADFETSLMKSLNLIIQNLRAKNKLSDFYNISRWYLWCEDHLPELGFNADFALFLSRLKIPGGIKGEAVRSEDPKVGPLNRYLEESLVRKALIHDKSKNSNHLRERVAVALCLAYGRNPLNYARLREEDLVNKTDGLIGADPLWELKIPRIKKRAGFRELFKIETCDLQLASMLHEMIANNRTISTKLLGKDMPRALFLREKPSSRYIGNDSQNYAFHMSSNDICELVGNWAKRMKLISPITGEPLKLTPRRLRYTFACNMAAQGVSRSTLAYMMDHTDTQNVAVYYELFDDLVPLLDKALVHKVGAVLKWFKGKPILSKEDSVNGKFQDKHLIFVGENNPTEQIDIGICGKTSLCYLDPPYTCYLCPKFQPYQHANHERVLEILLEDREKRIKKYESARLAIQVDDVIYAVAGAVIAIGGQNVK